MATKKAGGSSRNGRDSAGRRLGVKKYGHRQPISLIKITKIFSKEGKIIAQADIPRKVSTSLVKKSILENKVEKAKTDLDFLKKTKKIASYKKKKTIITKKK